MRKQTFSVSPSTLKETFEAIVKAGVARRVVIRNGEKVLLDLPIGIVGIAAVLAPVLAGLSLAVVLVRQYEIDVYHK